MNSAVVKHISDRIAVMYLGKILEYTDADTLYDHPAHPYTHALISAIPVPDPQAIKKRQILVGDVPSPIHPPPGCVFHTRCPYVKDACKVQIPGWCPHPELPAATTCRPACGQGKSLSTDIIANV
jgi:oligopeptide/dipeptide ABC transporter ATP-binding protein